MYPLFLAGDQHSLIEAGLVNGLTDSPERIEPPLATLTVFEEVPNGLFDQIIATLISPALESARST